MSSQIYPNDADPTDLADELYEIGQTADLTPMLDTIFLIILLLLATLMNSSVIQGFPVNLPTVAGQAQTQRQIEPVEISVNAQGRIAVGDQTVTLDRLPEMVRRQMSATPQAKVLLRADRAADYGTIAEVLFAMSNVLSSRQIILVTDSRQEVTP